MHVFNPKAEQAFDPARHMERILGWVGEGECRERPLGAESDRRRDPLSSRCYTGSATARTRLATQRSGRATPTENRALTALII